MILKKYVRIFDKDDIHAPKYKKEANYSGASYQIHGQYFFDIGLLGKFVMRQSLEKKKPRSQGFSSSPGVTP